MNLDFRKIFRELIEIKPEIRPYIAEVEVYLWLRYVKGWELEKPEKFNFDFKIKGKEVYIEVKTGYNTLTNNQILQLYENLDVIEGMYIATNGVDYPGYEPREEFETLLGTFTLYKLGIKEYLKRENRLFHAICGSYSMQNYYVAFGPEKYKEKIRGIFQDLMDKELIDFEYTRKHEWWLLNNGDT